MRIRIIQTTKKRTDIVIEALKDRAAKDAEQEKARLAAKEQAAKDEASRLADLKKQFEEDNLETLEYEEAERLKLVQAGVDEATRIKTEANAAQLALDDLLAANEIKNAEEVAAAKQKSLDDTFALTRSSLAATQGLSDIFFQNQLNQNAGNDKKLREIKKKQFETNKIFTVSSIVLDTIMGMMKAIAASPPPSPIGIAGAVITGIAGTAATIKALAAKFDGGAQGSFTPPSGDVNVGGGGAPNNFAPQVPQTPQSIPIPQQVYVTETDITGTQQQVNVIEGLSKIQ